MVEVFVPVVINDELKTAWASVLGCKENKISSSDNFFDLGGDLQDAIRLTAFPSRFFQGLTLSDVLRNPGFKDMAEVVYKSQRNEQSKAEAIMEEQMLVQAKHVQTDEKPLFKSIESSASPTEVEVPAFDRKEAIYKLKEILKQTLPGYMIPDVFVPIRRMPLNLSGKMDRKKVRVYGQNMTSNELNKFANKPSQPVGPSTAPSTTAELRMARAWAKVLNVDREKIGAHDNFFHKGGDSVRAMRLVTQARLYGLNVSVQQIFNFPTLAGMAAKAISLGSSTHTKARVEPFSLVSQVEETVSLRKRIASICGTSDLRVEDAYPCTPLQEGLMALSLKAPGRYIGQFVYKLSDHLDTNKFKKAWDLVAETTSSLRTRFIDLADVGLTQVVLNELPAWKQALKLEQYLAEDKLGNIGEGEPCSHFGFIEELGTRYFVLTAHHAVYDGWSIDLLLERFEKAYLGMNLQPDPGFNTFLQYYSNINAEQSKDFWTKELAGAPQCDFPPNVSNKYQPEKHQKLSYSISLTADSADSITMSSKIRAAWALLLSTYSGSESILFATTLSGRNVPLDDIEQIVGPTIATTPVHIRIDETQTIPQFLNMVQAQATRTIPHEQYGLHNIKRISRELDAICDIQSLLIIQTSGASTGATLGMEDVTKTYMANKMFHSFALSAECSISSAAIEADFSYDPAAISTHQVSRVCKQFEHILLQLVNANASSQTLVHDVERVSPADEQEIASWNSTIFPQRQNLVHELVERQVELQPDAPAICSWDGDMTFQQLNTAANRLAIQLRTLGVTKDVLVPLIFEKSVWTIVSMFAVLKAGGAYAALDPTHPESRLRGLIQKLGARLLLTSRACLEQCKGFAQESVAIDREYIDSLPAYTDLTVSAGVKPEHPAIILFTSGSTGLPKGIVIDHTAFTSSMLGHTSPLRFDQSKRVLQFTAYTSDVSMAEIFTSLSVGACVCVPSDKERMNALSTAINRMQADWAYLTPSAAILFQPEDVPTLKVLVFGGEVPSRENLTRWAPALYLVNVYGPAETSIWTSCNPGLRPTDPCSHIGHTLRCNAYIALAGQPDKLAPVGGAGELIVEGPNIACGYLNDPEKTAVTFLSSTKWMPKSSTQPRRLYRTGDLVRYLDDGRLDFIGRRDTQVKLRGLRIELGEVEEQLRRDIQRNELAVEAVTPSGQGGVQFLVAFVALRSEKDIVDMADLGVIANTTEALDTFKSWTKGIDARLSAVLPSFMVPSAFVPLWRLPLTGSAKTDRKALRALGTSMTVQELHQFMASTGESRAPSTEIELKMQRLWAKVLHRMPEEIKVEDNFFQHGGDSIRAMRLVSLARQEHLHLTVAEVLKFSTLSAMCERASVDEHDHQVVDVPPFALLGSDTDLERIFAVITERCKISSEDIDDIYPCTPLQDGLVMQAEKHRGSYVARFVFKVPGTVDIALFQHAWTTVAMGSTALRTRFVETEAGLLQVVHKSSPIWTWARQSLASYLELDSKQPMTTGQACCRLAIVENESDKYFVFAAHHAVFDGWSLPLLFDQVKAVYLGQTTSVSSLPFNAFINYYINIDKESSASYWRKALEDAPESSFPVSQPFNYQPKTHQKFYHDVQFSKSAGEFTVPTRVRAAWSILLSAYTGSKDIVYAATVNGRSAPIAGLENMLNPTFTTVPVRVKLPETDNSSLGDLLDTIQTQSTEMIPHEQFGIQNIRRLGAEYQAACNLQALLVVQNASENDQGLTGNDMGLESVDIMLGQGSNVYHSFALSMECSIRGEALDLEMTFDPEVLDTTQMERFVNQFSHIFQQLGNSKLPLTSIEPISPSDQKELALWNKQTYPASTTTITQLVHDMTLQQPDASAVCSWEGKLTYQMLDELSSSLASFLKTQKGVERGDLVPLVLEKSIWTVVTMLAVMKAGAAFAALDPAHPIERLRGLVRKLSAKLLITSLAWTAKAQELSEDTSIYTISPDGIQSLPTVDTSVSIAEVSSTDTAFILFTSGSTGMPKGIVIDHSAFTSSIKGHADPLYFCRGSRNFQFTAYTSDVSMGEMFTSLAVGACVCIPSDYERINELPQAMNRLAVDWAFFTPSVASLLNPADLPMLRTMVLGGETASAELIEKWAPALRLINSFGPAETSIWISRKATVTSTSSGSNIGIGIGCRTWVASPWDHNKLAPIGAVGELIAEGPNIAKGYLHDEAKTSAVFIKEAAWQPKASSRIFRTGDLVRYLSNGDIHFIGRRDTQVKLRGLRIEVGEIEHQLRQCLPFIKELAVEAIIPPGGTNSSKLLAAFIKMENLDLPEIAVITNPATLDQFHELIRGLPSQLSRVLPSHMVPSAYIPLSNMPLSGSAKTDRNVLRRLASELTPSEFQQLMGGSSSIREPTTPKEVVMRKLWAQALKVSETDLSIDDSFFLRGGDSVTAMRLVSYARANKFKLSVEQIFKHPILTEMAMNVETLEAYTNSVEPFALISDAAHVKELASTVCGVEPDTIDDIYPCTPLQDGLVALSLRNPGSYIAQFVFSVGKDLNTDRFCRSWNTVATDIALLRTRFIENQGTLAQVVISSPIEWIFESDLTAYLKKDKAKGMPLGQPTTRFAIIEEKRDVSHRYFVLTAHHATYDGWSLRLLLERIERTYAINEQKLPPNFNRFVAQLALQKPETAQTFWLNELADAPLSTFPHALALETQPQKHIQLKHTIPLPGNWQKQSQYTASTSIRAAWSLLLGAYSGTQDVIFAASLNGRTVPIDGIEEMIAPTLTTVPVRVKFDKQQTVGDFFASIQTKSTATMPFEHYGLQNIKRLSPEISTACDLQTLLVIETSDSVSSDSKDLHNNFLDLQNDSNESDGSVFHSFPLSLECSISPVALDIVITHDPTAIGTKQISRLSKQFSHLFKQLITAKESDSLASIEMVSPEDSWEIANWNRNVYVSSERSVHSFFEEMARQQPDAPALSSWEGEMSYSTLDMLSSKLSSLLRTKYAVGPGMLVPFLFEKSIWTVVSMVAVLKAGGAVVPLDPAHPLDRLAGLVKKVDGQLILCSKKSATLAEQLLPQILAAEKAMIESLPVQQMDSVQSNQSDPAFILFTSGSTGQPKGIIIDHSAFSSSMVGHASTLRFQKGSRNLQFTAYTSDVSMGEIFTSLAVGACICVPSDYERMNDLASAMERMKVDWAFLTPSVATLLDPLKVPTLKTLLFGGETATGENIKAWSERVYLINSFGPAECSIWTSCNPGINLTDQGTNIGLGLGCLNWITDPTDYKTLMPIGAVGELVIQGPNVAQGYLKEPVKTASAFVQNVPWAAGGAASQRVYRTGDLAKYREDGTIHFIGRRDTQVKLNGLRIEIGEVEEQLRIALPGVTEIAVEVVVPKSDKPTKILAAFIGLDEDRDSTDPVTDLADTPEARDRLQQLTEGLQTKLQQALPQHMIPKAFIPLPRLPLTASAKTDRNVLRRIVAQRSVHEIHSFGSGLEFRQPTTVNEQQMQKLWSIVLGLPETEIGANDSFFHRGGDSIGAMRLVSEARRVGLEISVEEIFRHPILSDLAEKVTLYNHADTKEPDPFTLVDEVDELKQSAATTCQITNDIIEDIYPCTPLQIGLISLAEKIPGSYISKLTFNLNSDLPLDRFKAAWQTVYQQTQILRTRFFRSTESELYQVVVRDSIDWDVENTMAVGQPLSQFSLHRSERSVDFTLKLHHSIYDEVTLSLLFSLFHDAYNGNPLAEVHGFPMFIKSMELSKSKDLTKAFWKNHLENASISSFPTLWSASYDPRPTMTMDISVPVSQHTSSGVTMATRIQAAWAMVVGTYSNTNDVVFGTTLSGRSSALTGIERVLGPTITTIPVRVSYKPSEHLGSLLAQIQTLSIERMRHEHFGLQNIQKVSSNARDACRFQNLLVVQQSEEAESPASNRLISLDDARSEAASFTGYSLITECFIHRDQVNIKLHFDPSLVDSTRARQITDLFGHILGQVCGGTDQKLSDIDIISPSDFANIRTWNSHLPLAIDKCIHDAIPVTTNAHRPALCFADRTMTYGELDRDSNKLAWYFKRSGIQVGEFVPFCFEKSSLAVICILAILKAGGAYVPLDPTHPKERHRDIIGTISAKFIVTSTESSTLFNDLDISVLAITSDFLEQLDVEGPIGVTSKPNDPAYAIFTSGSTGKPKGVVIQHSALTTGVSALGKALDISSSSRVLQFAAYTFDASVGEIFMTLLFGACVCTPVEAERRGGITKAMARMRVTLASFSPSFVNVFEPKDIPTVETLLVAGEAMTTSVIEKWASRVKLVNGYGPTEATVLCTVQKVEPQSTLITTIGKGTSVIPWIVDQNDENILLPIDCVGELLLQGPALAQGYLNEPEKTVQSFITSPSWASRFGLADNTRFYKTGDLVKYEPNGSLRYISRKDTQVKLRGHRIELGEIETKAHGIIPTARDVIAEVVSSKLAGGSRTIALFIVGTNGQTMDFSEFDRKLARMLPSYMLPSMYIPLESIPLNQNGKADRKKLQQYVMDASIDDLSRFSLANTAKVQPTTDLELKISKLWAQVLQRKEEEIDIHDSFIRSGGDSIAAIKMVSLARSLGLSLPMEDILKDMTLEELAVSTKQAIRTTDTEPFSLLESYQDKLEHASIVCQVPMESISDIYPCTIVQEEYIVNASETVFSTVQWSFEMDQTMPLAVIKSAWETVAKAHALLRTQIFEHHSTLLQAVVEAPLHWSKANSLDTYLDADKKVQFSFGSPLSRQALFLDTNKVYFVWTCAHAIYDLISIKVILNNFKQCLQGDQLEREIPYTRFVRYLTQQPDPTDFWRDHFLNYEPSQLYQKIEQPKLDMSFKGQLNLPNLSNSFTTATYIQTAWAMAISKHTEGSDVTLNLNLNGRGIPMDGIEQLAGPTAVSVPMRVTVDGSATIRQILRQTQDRAANISRWQHTGIKNIKRVSQEAKLACETSIPLIIYASGPLEDLDDEASFKRIGTRQVSRLASPMVLMISLIGKRVEMMLPFDSREITPEKLSALLWTFARVLMEMKDGMDKMVTEVQSIAGAFTAGASTTGDSTAGWLKFEREDIVEGMVNV